MKHRHKARRIVAALLSLTLCCGLALGTPLSAGAAELPTQRTEASPSPAPSTSTATPAPTATPEPPGSPSPSVSPNPSASPSATPSQSPAPSGSPGPEESPAPSGSPSPSASPSPSPTPEVRRYTVTFQMGSFGTATVEVEEGERLSQDQVPELQELPAATILGWFDGDGQPVDPLDKPITQDVTFTARWGRQVGDLLNTDEHVSFVSGYNTGLFLPEKKLSRAEACSLFYKLLRSTDWEKKTFPDVKSDQWYAEAVETLAGLGILSGYEDGTFAPGHDITRAEFVSIAMAFSTLDTTGDSSFSDVKDSFWAADAINSAAAQGWISGFGDGTFAPNSPVTRAQAVSILNKMLGRTAPENVKELADVKSFYDLFPTHWAYGTIIEATNVHTHHMVEGEEGEAPVEVWDTYEKDQSTVESHFVRENGALYYVDGATKKIVRGATTINGVKYLFNSSTGTAVTGFAMDGQYRRYYKAGAQQEDISELGVVSGPYFIQVYKPSNYLIIFAKDPATGAFNTPVQAMRVSCGTPTPTGTYYTPARYRWLKMVGDTWAQWCTQIQGDYLFHSVPNWTKNNKDLEVYEYNQLGNTRSLGCIRLNCEDAKWIYDNCQLGTQVNISSTLTSGPLAKPAGLQIPSWHTWDPTDPTAYVYCDQHGCHQNLH